MTDEFKRRLRQYAEGTLSEPERAEMEAELEKLEAYQQALEEVMEETGERSGRLSKAAGTDKEEIGSRQEALSADKRSSELRERKILRKGKWRARFSNALTAVALLIAATFIGGVVTSLFYGVGEPNRMSVYQDVIRSAVALTQPNTDLHLSGQGNAFLTADLTGPMVKKIGASYETVGRYSLRMLLSWPGVPKAEWTADIQAPSFYYPDDASRSGSRSDWTRLEKLPEGTVAEAYVSLNRLFDTDELLKLLEEKGIEPVWFAVDGGGQRGAESTVIRPVGFPANPVWLHEEMQVVSETEERRGWFGKTFTRGSVSPSLNVYGSGEVRERNFRNSLTFLQQYPSLTAMAAPWLKPDQLEAHIVSAGVKLFGVVLTGPTKELLRLREEGWVAELQVGEVRLWNWRD